MSEAGCERMISFVTLNMYSILMLNFLSLLLTRSFIIFLRVILRCNGNYIEKTCPCKMPRLTEDEINAAFVRVVNKLAAERRASDQTGSQRNGEKP